MPKISGALAEVLVGLRMMAVFSRWVGWAAGIGLSVAGLVGCPTSTDCADPRNAETCGKEKVEVLVTVSAPVARMRAAEKAELSATLERKGEWPSQGELILSAKDLVGGVTMEPVQVAADATEATLEFVADAAVPQGAFPFTLVATPVDDRIPPAEVALEAVVPGPPGTLDLSFGGDGEVSISSPDMEYAVYDVELDPSGGLIIAGQISDRDPILMRIAPDGDVDAAFGEAVQETLTDDSVVINVAIAVTATGLLVLTGRPSDDPYDTQLSVTKYDFHGRADSAFGHSDSIKFENSFDDLRDVELLSRTSDILIVANNKMASMTHEGRLNEAFGDGGTWTELPFHYRPALYDDDVVLLPSATEIWTLTEDVLAPYSSDLDSLAARITVYEQSAETTHTMCCDPARDYILCAGWFVVKIDEDFWTGAWAARVLADGSLDPTFGSGGILTRFLEPDAHTSNLVVTSLKADHFILWEVDDTSSVSEYLASYKPDGSMNADFGDAGRMQINANAQHLPVDHLRGRIIVYSDGDGVITISRYWL